MITSNICADTYNVNAENAIEIGRERKVERERERKKIAAGRKVEAQLNFYSILMIRIMLRLICLFWIVFICMLISLIWHTFQSHNHHKLHSTIINHYILYYVLHIIVRKKIWRKRRMLYIIIIWDTNRKLNEKEKHKIF